VYKKDIYYEILKEVEPYYDNLNLFNFLAISVIFMYRVINEGEIELIYFSLLVSVVGFIMYIFKYRIDIINKLMISIILLLIFVFRSFILNGFIGSGFLSVLLLITISIIFFSEKRSLIVIAITLVVYLFISVLVNYDIVDSSAHIVSIKDYKREWYLQAFTIIVAALTIFLSMKSVKRKLIKTHNQLKKDHIKLSEQSVVLLNQKEELKELAYYDRVMNIFNNYYLTEVLPKKLTNLKDQILIGIIDITNLRIINSIYNQIVINEHLKNVVDIFVELLPKNAYIGRYSSDIRILYNELLHHLKIQNVESIRESNMKIVNYLVKVNM